MTDGEVTGGEVAGGAPAWRGPSPGWTFALMLALTLAVRAQTFGDPVLHMDEQFYLLVGDRMLHGAVPYVDIWDRKPPGLFLIYAGARLLGGEGIVQYQLLAALSAAATGFVATRIARRLASPAAALIAGAAYILWLNLEGGDGGQAPVFYNLLVALAALSLVRLVEDGQATVARIGTVGAATMLLIGLSLQIKYSTVFEGMFFGLTLIWAARRAEAGLSALVGHGLLWIGCALLPTAVAAGIYAVIGQLDAFLFANFLSIGERAASPLPATLKRLATLVAISSPLLAAAAAARLWRKDVPDVPVARFVLAWLLTACAAVLIFGTYFRGYGLPVMLPAAIAGARVFDRCVAARRTVSAMLALALVAGQATIAIARSRTGGDPGIRAAVAAMRGHQGCLYVHDGHAILYHLDRSCVPTRFAFPGHLNQANEAGAIGVDAVKETARILDTRPGVIAIVSPAWKEGNRATRRLVEARIARDYRLIHTAHTGSRVRLLYMLRPNRPAPPPRQRPRLGRP